MVGLVHASSEFRVVRVADLPPPFAMEEHCLPWDAAYLSARLESVDQGGVMVSDEALGRVHLASFARLGDGSCRSHGHDWDVASRAAVDVLLHASTWTLEGVAAFVRRSGVPAELVEATVSLLNWPITVSGGSLTNGQHRRCAMHVQGVEETVAVYS